MKKWRNATACPSEAALVAACPDAPGEIHAYIAQNNPAAALRTVQRVGQIVTFPDSGRRVPDYTPR